MDKACTAKNISWCQTEELDDSNSAQRNLENFPDDSNSPMSTSSNKQTIQKNLQPLKIKIPKQSKPPKCEKEKPTCKVKSNLKRKLENEEEVENKGFNIGGDMAKFLEHLDYHTKDLFQSTKEVLDENLPIIYNSLATVKSFVSLLGKIIFKIPHKIDPISGEITLKCKGCLLHCPQNCSLTSPPGQLTANSIKKKKNNANTICTYETFSKSLFIMHIPKKNVYKNLLCIHSTVENLYKNSAVD